MTDVLKGEDKVETVEVHNIDQFVYLLKGWHEEKVAMLKHMREIPEGTTIENEAIGREIYLTGDILASFKAGIDIALFELGELPFATSENIDSEAVEQSDGSKS